MLLVLARINGGFANSRALLVLRPDRRLLSCSLWPASSITSMSEGGRGFIELSLRYDITAVRTKTLIDLADTFVGADGICSPGFGFAS